MKRILLSFIAVAGIASANQLSQGEIQNLMQSNVILNNPTVNVEKAEKVSDTVTTLKLSIKMQTQQGVQERPAQAFVVKDGMESYTFIGGGYKSDGQKIDFTLDKAKIDKGVLWSDGTGKEVIYVVTNPSCSWCAKLEASAAKSTDFHKNYTVKKIIMPFFDNATEKSYWILSGKDNAEISERYKKVMVDNDNTWATFKISPEEKVRIDALLAQSLDAARELDAQGTPAVFDSNFQPIQNWPDLVK